jgi:hypothetical protein
MKCRVVVKISNTADVEVVLSEPSLVYGSSLRPNSVLKPLAESDMYKCGFSKLKHDENYQSITLQNGDSVFVSVELDNATTEGEYKEALAKNDIATLYFNCLWMGEKPKREMIVRRIENG